MGIARAATRLLLGVDVGTSDVKVLATTPEGTEVVSESVSTEWTVRGANVETSPAVLSESVLGLLERAVAAAAAKMGRVEVASVAVASMGESGVLLEGPNAVAPIVAWFDPRGGDELRAASPGVLSQFCGRTGLPVSSLPTIAKLAWMRAHESDLRGKTWLSVAEFLVYRLGGMQAAEFSLVARTGLLDQDTQDVWPEALAEVGADASLIPPRVYAGTPLGMVSSKNGRVASCLHGAVLTVAGHDHAVAAVGCGVLGADDLFDSLGTAEALLRTISRPLSFAARERLALNGINAVTHVMSGQRLLVAGTRAGLVLRRLLRLIGADEDERRDKLDRQACDLSEASDEESGVVVSGAANDDGGLRIFVTSDDVTPVVLWRAALRAAIEEADRSLRLMDEEVGRAVATVCAGGWTRMQSVREVKRSSLPGVRFSDHAQAGAFGAAMFAAHALVHATVMAAQGDPTAIALERSVGPTEEFARQFTRARLPAGGVFPLTPAEIKR